MNRREFMACVSGTLAAVGTLTRRAYAQTAETTGGTLENQEAMRLNQERVQARNRDRSTVVARGGMVCTSQPLASGAGLDILKSGGNAIEAAICANAVLSVVEPMNCGPGGDLFAIVWSERDKKLFGLNASGRSPYAWTLGKAAEMGVRAIPAYSPLAWNVPGCVSGWAALLERFGSLPAAKVLEAAIHYAQDGFAVSSIIADDWRFAPKQFPTLAEVFAPGGRTPAYGEMFSNPQMAALFESLARDGLRSFYEGEIAGRIVKFSEEQGGLFALRDFQEHQATWVDPVNTSYRGFEVWEIPPNGQGISVLQMLNMLETFDIAALEPNSAEQLHLFIEAKKLAFEDRAVYYADMEKADVPLEWLISKEYGRERAKLIDPKRASERVTPGAPQGKDTVYLTAADKDGNMISLIQSTYHGWGSHLAPTGLGFALQNRGMSFSLEPMHRNRLEPHKRPFHTIIPAFVTRDGAPKLSFGVMGGDFQPQGHTQVLMNLIDYGMSPQQAGEQPRIEHTGSSTPAGGAMERGGAVRCEPGIPDSVIAQLVAMGHSIKGVDDVFGGYQAIWREEDPLRYFGGSDPRKDGCAMGY